MKESEEAGIREWIQENGRDLWASVVFALLTGTALTGVVLIVTLL